VTIYRTISATLVLFWTGCTLAVAAPAEPSDPGQVLEYRLAWNGISAADATVEIRPERIGPRRTYTIEARARTNRFIDLFYPFRGHARTIFLANDRTPLQFYYDRNVRDVHYRTVVDFDHDDSRARSIYEKNGVTRKELDLPLRELFDPITAVFHARRGSSAIGTEAGYDIFTGESRYRVELRIDGQGTITVPAGRFEALRITPTVMKVYADRRPPDPRLKNATIWVSEDPEHLLLQIRSEIFVGAVTLDLVSRALQP